jgi:hypothetical protein
MIEGTVAEQHLFNQVADKWGGKGCRRVLTETEGTFASDDHMLYRVAFPGQTMETFEDSGRPCGKVKVPAGRLYVRCITDAPDAWWSIDIELFEYTNGEQF